MHWKKGKEGKRMKIGKGSTVRQRVIDTIENRCTTARREEGSKKGGKIWERWIIFTEEVQTGMVMARGEGGGGGRKGRERGREGGVNTNLMYADVALITEYHLIRLLGLRLQQFTFFIEAQ